MIYDDTEITQMSPTICRNSEAIEDWTYVDELLILHAIQKLSTYNSC